ncbi:Modification methylase BspRI [Pseudovibrio sp. Ad13]|uniref:DNA cytosine methyltransferase n=1 Tax=Pseudovibrio sp. Ad13 TaxID=989396 RepID=UPI0007AE6166|nr:DNA cytosine methyltransferase [Pseudovibrio sp. Ad13]KZK83008.1 Modification methylase BspRI [Pseudovibrio sp. Ad13]
MEHLNLPGIERLEYLSGQQGEIIIDAFAGGGGASTGIEMALGRSPDLAINHCEAALAMHAANHPETVHLPESVWDVDLKAYTAGRPVGLLWASPDCRHFSKARGSKPTSKSVRMLAWSIVNFCQKLGKNRPRIIVLENVMEFRGWEDFEPWKVALGKLGYQVEVRDLKACDYGAPTIRKRMFMVARRDKKAIKWPAPTHGDPSTLEVKSGQLLPWKTAADCIDWSIPCPSIFERKKPLADNTLKRIAAGIKKFVIDAPEPFILNMSHGGSLEPMGKPVTTIKTERGGCRALVVPYIQRQFGNSVGGEADSPLGTVTASGGGKSALVAASLVQTGYGEREGQLPRTMDIEAPLGTVVAGGAKHALVSAFLAQHNTGVVGRSAEAPVSTILQTGSHQALVTSHLMMMRGTCKDGQPADAAMPTLTAGGNHIAEVRAFLMAYYGTSVGQDTKEPMGTVTTKDRFSLVTVEIGGEPYAIVDIGMRMLTPEELYRAQGFPENYKIDFEFKGKPLSKKEQVAKCGNSVCPPIAKAIIEANLPDLKVTKEAA